MGVGDAGTGLVNYNCRLRLPLLKGKNRADFYPYALLDEPS